MNTKVLNSNLCDCNNTVIRLGDISAIGDNGVQVAFENCTLIKRIRKTDGTTKDDAEDLDLVMLMYNLIECSSNYSEMKGRLQFYFKDEAICFNNDIANTDVFKSFKYEAKF